jgi:predicted MPP superfamily phosphohydrolase
MELKLIHITDLHFGSVSSRHLKRVIDRTNELQPNLVLFTGDLIDPHSVVTAGSLAVLHELKAPAYWTSGNHERYVDLGAVMELLRSTPLIPLRNEVRETQRKQLVGIGDNEGRLYVEKTLEQMKLNPDLFTVLMYHHPEGLEAAGAAGVDLMLSGRTHRGQIFLLGWLVKMRFKQLYGVYEANGCTLYVSCGAGAWGPLMRLGSRNEILLIQLEESL